MVIAQIKNLQHFGPSLRCLHTWKCRQCGPESRQSPRGLSSEGHRCWSICLLSQTRRRVSSSLSASCCWRSRWKASCLRSCPPVSRFHLREQTVLAAGRLSRSRISAGDSLTSGNVNTESFGISDRLLFLCVVTNEGIRASHLKCRSHSKRFKLSYISLYTTAKRSPSSSSHFVDKILLADSADLADVVDKAGVSFRCSVALTDPDVSEPLQEVSPGVGP